MNQPPNLVAATSRNPGCLGLLARVTWMLAGNIALLFLAVGILQGRGNAWLDLAYAFVVAGLMVVRYVDITWLGGTTADGEPATLGHWWRYSLRLVILSALVWGLARLL